MKGLKTLLLVCSAIATAVSLFLPTDVFTTDALIVEQRTNPLLLFFLVTPQAWYYYLVIPMLFLHRSHKYLVAALLSGVVLAAFCLFFFSLFPPPLVFTNGRGVLWYLSGITLGFISSLVGVVENARSRRPQVNGSDATP